jgi:hypothetical protein
MKKDDVIIFEQGDFYNYDFSEPFIALRDFNIKEVENIVKGMPSVYIGKSKSCEDDVVEYLKTNKYIVEAPCKNIHLGRYGDIDISGDLE